MPHPAPELPLHDTGFRLVGEVTEDGDLIAREQAAARQAEAARKAAEDAAPSLFTDRSAGFRPGRISNQ
jgi:hypothetical protein